MLIVIAGFPGAFVHAFFTGSLLIETIFSLDGLGLLGFESVLNRDYPVVFATLYIFSLIGVVVNLISDLDLYLDRSAHRLRDAGGLRWTRGPRSSRPTRRPIGVGGLEVPPSRHCDRDFAAQQAALGELQGQPARLLVVVAVPGAVRDLAVRRIHRQRQADLHLRQRPVVLPGGRDLSRHHLRQDARSQSVRHRRRLSRRLSDGPDQEGRRHRDLAAGPLLLQHAGEQAAVAVPVQADLDADAEGLRIRRHARLRQMRRRSNATGSAPTTAAATWWRG